jgi:hypothetical protein
MTAQRALGGNKDTYAYIPSNFAYIVRVLKIFLFPGM